MSPASPDDTAQVVLDTNVISELVRPAPGASVAGCVSRLPTPSVCTTWVMLAEVRFGIARLPAGHGRALLDDAADVFATFADQVLAFDAVAAGHHADIGVEREHAGAPISGFDAQIAAVSRARFAVLVTRNTGDFDHLGLDVIDPCTQTQPHGPTTRGDDRC